jgi:hypothetical protein
MRNLSGEGITTPTDTEVSNDGLMQQKTIPGFINKLIELAGPSSKQTNQTKQTNTPKATNVVPNVVKPSTQTNAVTDFQVKGPAPERERVTNLPISESIQTQMANVAPPTTAAPVLGGRGAMPEFDGRALSGDLSSSLVDPRNIFGEVGRGSGYDIPQQTITPGASAAFQDFTKQPIVTTNVPVKQNKEREEPSISKFNVGNFKTNILTTPSTKTGATIFGGNNPINPDGLPGKDSVGAIRNGIYAGDGMEWTEDGGRVYTGVNAGVTGDTKVINVSKDVFSTGADILGDYNIVEELFGIGKEKKKKKAPAIATTTTQPKKQGTLSTAQVKKAAKDKKEKNVKVATAALKDDSKGQKQAKAQVVKSKDKVNTQKNLDNVNKALKKISQGGSGGFNKGGLASKPKAKKTKTTNKRGLAARK